MTGTGIPASDRPSEGLPRPEPFKRSNRSPAYQSTWGALQRLRLRQAYLQRRERYAAEASAQGLVYREADVGLAVRHRLADRGYAPARRRLGEVHTFAFVPRVGGNAALYGDLVELGPVTEFDYAALGYTLEELRQVNQHSADRRGEINRKMLAALREAHRRRPVDWVFVYANGWEVEAAGVRQIVDELGMPVVNMCLDDKQSWTGPPVGGQRVGQVDIAPVFDLSWTSARVACEWYLVEGGRPVYLPEGFDSAMYRPMEVEQDIAVSFLGAGYGYRPSVIRHLQRSGILVQTFGPGWPSGWTWGDEQVEVFNRSVINLGMGGIGFSEDFTNVKSRDFEIPGTGGGVYLTRFNPDLAQHFVIGQEILCYSTRDELVELVRYYQTHPEEVKEIAARGRDRCLAEHRWLHRYDHVLRLLGVLVGPDENREGFPAPAS